MKYIFSHCEKLSKKINAISNIYLFLDYDGTLTSIVARPELANLLPNVKSLLRKLTRNHKFSIAIISGRSIKQLRQKVKIRGIGLVGNHGLEIESPTLKYVHPLAKKSISVIKDIKNRLNTACKPIKGSFIEDKGLTLSLHFRLVKKKDYPALKQSIHKVLVPYLIGKKVKITRGKKVLEIRPAVKWDKGSLVDYLLRRKKRMILPIYIGDDETDENAFKRLRKKGITVFVGRRNTTSNAEYYVKDTKEVVVFLGLLYSS